MIFGIFFALCYFWDLSGSAVSGLVGVLLLRAGAIFIKFRINPMSEASEKCNFEVMQTSMKPMPKFFDTFDGLMKKRFDGGSFVHDIIVT